MHSTPVSICSNALLMLGDAPIADFNEGSDRARLAANLWPTARDFVLRLHPWNCAVKRVVLAPDILPPAFEWGAQFTLPDDWLRTLQVGEGNDFEEYRIEGRKLLMNSNACQLRYIWQNDQPASWDSILVWAMTMAMRAVFAYGVTQSGSLEEAIDRALRGVLQKARAADGQEEPPDALSDNPLMRARFGGGGWSRFRSG